MEVKGLFLASHMRFTTDYGMERPCGRGSRDEYPMWILSRIFLNPVSTIYITTLGRTHSRISVLMLTANWPEEPIAEELFFRYWA